jgi:formylglycine-generating enzyme required for sulfatase activity
MVLIRGGPFIMGTNDSKSMPNERPARKVVVNDFWLAATPVTNAEFGKFIEETGYITTAERPVDWEELKKQLPPGTPKPPPETLQPGSLVFTPPQGPVDLRELSQWWTWTLGACWKHPEGPESNIDGRADHPVVQVSFEDAEAYARWAGKRLPTEAEWEYAARGGLEQKRYPWGDEFLPQGKYRVNCFTGEFPYKNTAADGYTGTSPVREYPPNGFGLFDMAGNVWNWTSDVYREIPGAPPDPFRRVIKGGSFLCHPAYCESYRPSARRGTPYDTGSAHVGFRCARDVTETDPVRETGQKEKKSDRTEK